MEHKWRIWARLGLWAASKLRREGSAGQVNNVYQWHLRFVQLHALSSGAKGGQDSAKALKSVCSGKRKGGLRKKNNFCNSLTLL